MDARQRAGDDGEETSHYLTLSNKIEKPDLDDRDYRVIQLSNGLKAVVIHDASADKAAASLSVAVGALQDPSDIHGLAHFCEHMLLKGSVQYPDEGDFMGYISSNGGTKNGATGSSHMYYHFTVSPTHLSGGLSRLAAFLHSPLFTPSLTAREIYAVDSESKRNAQNDTRRIYQVRKSLSARGHPFSQFQTGNWESITENARALETKGDLPQEEGEEGDGGAVGRETRRRLIKWWEETYCAGRMALAVLGKESLDELTSIVLSEFSPIENRSFSPRPEIVQPSWGDSELGTVIFIKTVKDLYGFNLEFPIPDQRPNIRNRPATMLAHFLGHEGPGSVCTYLKKRGWLLTISAGATSPYRGCWRFSVSGTLTKEGFLHYREVIRSIFSYVSLLRSSSPLPEYHFAELSKMSAIRFRFREKQQPAPFVNSLSKELLEEHPPEWLLSSGLLDQEWNEELFRDLVASLRPETVRVSLQAMALDEAVIGKDVQWQRERWYETEYFVRKFDATFLEGAGAPNIASELHLPKPNPYIPENLDVERRDVGDPLRAPMCIRRSALSALWYKKDGQFWVPKAHFRVQIRSRIAYLTPRQAVLTKLLADLVEDALAEVAYDAELSGLSYSVSNVSKGIELRVGGYSDKLHVLLQTVLDTLVGLVVSPDRLNVFKEKTERQFKNWHLGQPSNMAVDYSKWLLMPVIWTPSDKLAELKFISTEDIEQHKKELLSRVYIEGLATGNLDESRAVSFMEAVERTLGARALSSSEHPHPRALILPAGENLLSRKKHANPAEVNSSLSYWIQLGAASDRRLRARLEFVSHIMREPCFTQLRTREQLGYIVANQTWTIAASTGLYIKVQSTRAPWYLEERVEAFLEDFSETIAHMSSAAFQESKNGLIVKKLEKAKNLAEETVEFWGHILSGFYDFTKEELGVDDLHLIDQEELVRFYDEFLRPSTAKASRRKASVHVLSQQIKDAPPEQPNVRLLTEDEEATFKASLPCYPAATPVEQSRVLLNAAPSLRSSL